MATHVMIDDKLVNEARKLGKHRTKKQAVTAALQEYIESRKRLQIFDLFGKVDYDPDYDYKRLRGGKQR